MNDPSHSADRATDAEAARQFAAKAARLLADSKCEDVVALDVRDLSQVAHFLVIATGTSDRQIRSVADDVKELARQEAEPLYGREGLDSRRWLIVDFVDVVVHLFDAETRAFYDLESLWGDAERVNWQAMTEAGQFARLSATQRAQAGG